MPIREERRGDAGPIGTILQEAFRGHPQSQGREAAIVEALRRQHALVVSLVAEIPGADSADGEGPGGTEAPALAGMVAFSRVVLEGSGGGWFGLGPLAVQPAWQRRGIGSRLVERGLADLRRLGATGCVLLGDAAFYGRFGFVTFPGLTLDGAPDHQVLGLPFGKAEPEGRIAFHSAFYEA